MSRPLRLEYPGALYHVTCRGNAGNRIFKQESDRELFLHILRSVIKEFNWLCHAYCLMDTHYHLMMETPDGNLAKGMRQLNGVYTQKFNWKHKLLGHLFQGRYKAVLVDRENYLLELCRYIVLNPVRSKKRKRPEDWTWSSYRATAGFSKVPDFINVDWILNQFGRTRDRAQMQYRSFVRDGMSRESPWQDLKGQIFLGGQGFVSSFKKVLEKKGRLGEIPKVQRYADRPRLQELFLPGVILKKPKRNQTIYAAHIHHGYSLKEIGDHLQIHYTTVSKVIKEERSKN